ncbi:MAG: M20/M25/M40 family metallo-hydrolase [Deltaproteobacteria bacterium]|nr:M20/M25/M40 family metallo-hydrolase [Deltaproteobacteria bacterium]
MTRRKEALAKIFRRIRKEELTRLAMDLVNIPSPTGEEGKIAQFIVEWFLFHGIEAVAQEIEEGRYNAVGRLRGSGKGLSLTFNAHLDTAFSGVAADLPILGEIRAWDQPSAYLVEDRIYGQGIVNDKGPLAAFLLAGKAIKESGVELKGDLILAGVAGEIGIAQVDEYRGSHYRGKGIGTQFLLTHGFTSDYAVVAEPSQFGITWALPGVAYFKISVRGEVAYAPFNEPSPEFRMSKNAILKIIPVIQAIESWAERYEEKNQYRFSGGLIRPKVLVGAIAGGRPYKPNTRPAHCAIYVDVRIPPQRNLPSIEEEFRRAIAESGVETKVELYLYRPGYEGQGVEPLVETVRQAYRFVFKKDPQPIRSPYTSMWNDNNIYHMFGIPAVKWGPSPRGNVGDYSHQTQDDLWRAAQVYAAVAWDICSRERVQDKE